MADWPSRHRCPWPACARLVLPWFWGCAAHWMMIPIELREGFTRSRVRDAEVQPADHQMAIERIRNWMSENALPDDQRESRSTPDLEADFTAGFASDGQVVLFWPRAGEYLILGPREVATLRRLFSRWP